MVLAERVIKVFLISLLVILCIRACPVTEDAQSSLHDICDGYCYKRDDQFCDDGSDEDFMYREENQNIDGGMSSHNSYHFPDNSDAWSLHRHDDGGQGVSEGGRDDSFDVAENGAGDVGDGKCDDENPDGMSREESLDPADGVGDEEEKQDRRISDFYGDSANERKVEFEIDEEYYHYHDDEESDANRQRDAFEAGFDEDW